MWSAGTCARCRVWRGACERGARPGQGPPPNGSTTTGPQPRLSKRAAENHGLRGRSTHTCIEKLNYPPDQRRAPLMITFQPPRRGIPLVAGVLSTALLLSACGNQTGSENGNPSNDGAGSGVGSLLPEAEGNVDYPLTLDTAHGEIELEERPQRIAVLGWNPNHDAAAALGVTPVYAASRMFDYGWMDEEWLDSIEVLEEREDADVNLEAVAAADPDLIFGAHTEAIFEEEDIERLGEIAPVLEAEEIPPGDRVDWREAPRLLG